jgi:hypothetical protein
LRLAPLTVQAEVRGTNIRVFGEYVFLEANPSPMFLGFQDATGLPLAEILAELLTCDDLLATPRSIE